MTEQYVVAGLVRKRAELSGEIEHTQARLRQLVKDLEHIDGALLLFDPNAIPEAIKPKRVRPPPMFPKGLLSRAILDELRVNGPADTESVTAAVMKRAKLDPDDPAVFDDAMRRVRYGLRDQVRAGRVTRGGDRRWQVA